MLELLIKDETLAGKTIRETYLPFESDTLKVKDVIKARVFHEVEKYNAKLPEYFNGLVQPTEAEQTINGYRLKDKRKVDAEKQYYIALDSYLKNAYFVLINNEQVESLEQEVTLTKNTIISFVKLTPLIGG